MIVLRHASLADRITRDNPAQLYEFKPAAWDRGISSAGAPP
jgi:hypothetical protein